MNKKPQYEYVVVRTTVIPELSAEIERLKEYIQELEFLLSEANLNVAASNDPNIPASDPNANLKK